MQTLYTEHVKREGMIAKVEDVPVDLPVDIENDRCMSLEEFLRFMAIVTYDG